MMQDAKERHIVHRNILGISGNVDRVLTEKLLDLLLQERVNATEGPRSLNGFVHCVLILQTLSWSSERLKFRVKTTWTGLDVKQEVEKLYDIPTDHEVLIINDKTVSDQQTIDHESFQFKTSGQVVYVFLTKRKIVYEGSEIRIRDLVKVNEMQVTDADSCSSQAAVHVSKKREKRKQKKR